MNYKAGNTINIEFSGYGATILSKLKPTTLYPQYTFRPLHFNF